MITVNKALTYDVCENFRLVAGDGGLNNTIRIVGFFEWEEGEKIISSFIKGVFVLTTLSAFREDRKQAERNIKLMINNGISGIAIKDVFFDNISDDLKEYAEKKQVPIFFFSDTYINDIIYNLQNAIENDRKYSTAGVTVASLIKEELSREQQEQRLHDINPYLSLEKMFSLYCSDDNPEQGSAEEISERYESLIFQIEKLMRSLPGYKDIVYSIVNYRRGFFILLHGITPDNATVVNFLKQLEKKILETGDTSNIYVGASAANATIDTSVQLKRAIFANVKSILDKKKFSLFMDLGLDYVVFKHISYEASNVYFENTLKKLKEAEANHTPFLETLLTYASCKGNIDETAEILHQHRNTIRYRAEKIKSILGDDDIIMFEGKLFYFVRMYRARPYLLNLT